VISCSLSQRRLGKGGLRDRTGARPKHVKPTGGEAELVGNGGDYVGEATGLISSAAGDFVVSGVKAAAGSSSSDYCAVRLAPASASYRAVTKTSAHSGNEGGVSPRRCVMLLG